MIWASVFQTLLVFHIESTFYMFRQFHFYAHFFFCHLYCFFDRSERIPFAASWPADLADGLQRPGGHAVGQPPGFSAQRRGFGDDTHVYAGADACAAASPCLLYTSDAADD